MAKVRGSGCDEGTERAREQGARRCRPPAQAIAGSAGFSAQDFGRFRPRGARTAGARGQGRAAKAVRSRGAVHDCLFQPAGARGAQGRRAAAGAASASRANGGAQRPRGGSARFSRKGRSAQGGGAPPPPKRPKRPALPRRKPRLLPRPRKRPRPKRPKRLNGPSSCPASAWCRPRRKSRPARRRAAVSLRSSASSGRPTRRAPMAAPPIPRARMAAPPTRRAPTAVPPIPRVPMAVLPTRRAPYGRPRQSPGPLRPPRGRAAGFLWPSGRAGAAASRARRRVPSPAGRRTLWRQRGRRARRFWPPHERPRPLRGERARQQLRPQ